ncbi:Ger(x)C family spore germination protein [Paenibacillus guangzhouensis]|uniref:Ger(x)C family spore germination protein n=1 Tax=Paenibacillus guangzhouensis TaxID=1473112 RepID=UPI001266B9A9|nr:Ger(x)C family spore germination protein [Paenibacillus guangzhouensis]
MRMKCKMIMLMFAGSTLIAGCVQSNVLEKLGISVAIGFDGLPNDKLNVTSVILNPTPESPKKSEVITTIANSGKGARIRINSMLSHSSVSGQVRVVMFDRKLAKEGVSDVVENLTRDPFLGDSIYLAMSDGSANELLSYTYPQIPDIGTFLYEMIQQHIQDDWVPSCTVQDYRSAMYSIGGDAVLPLLKKKDENVEISGLVLFRDDKAVGEIDPSEGYLLKLLRGKQKEYLKEINVKRSELRPYLLNEEEGNVHIVFSNIGRKVRIDLTSMKPIQFKVRVHMDVELQEITDHYNFSNDKAIRLLQKKIGEEMTKETNQLIQKLQRMKSDAIGFGNVYRSSVRNAHLTRKKWEKMYPEAKVETQFKVNLIRTGTIE